MKFINRKTHAVLDYVVSIVLIASPWLLGFSGNDTAKLPPMAIGILMIIASLMTNYEGGLIKVLSMTMHLTMDIITGILLAISPWVLGFSDQVFIPHLLFGILEIGVAICTQGRSQHATLSR